MAEPVPPAAEEVTSPCRRACRYVPEAGLCDGCGRTLAEIEAWAAADPRRRREILDWAEARLAALVARGAGSERPPRA